MMPNFNDKKWQSQMQVGLDFANMMSERLGTKQGLKPAQLGALKAPLGKAHAALKLARTTGKLPFYDLPYQQKTAAQIKAVASAGKGKFDSFLVLGIGGSALGNLCLHSALNHFHHNELTPKQRKGLPRIYVPDNVDPDRMNALFDVVDLKKACVNVITKSGNTAETMSQFMVIVDKLTKAVGKKNLPKHLIVTTDKEKGNLREIARELKLMTFEVPDGVGGRFSVLTSVGLLSAAFSGIDIDELLAGAAAMDKRCLNADMGKNPAMMFAALTYLAATTQGKPIHVMMPYSNRLYLLADWFRQLWAESLGKKLNRKGKAVHTGPTPVKALGATDQHSQVQLYVEGPFDKVTCFLRVEEFDRELAIPKLFKDKDGIAYLGGQHFGTLLKAEQTATEVALTQNNRSNMTIRLPKVNAFTLGQVIYLLEAATAYAGELYNIDAFDQPGVEAGKVATYALMGKKGFEAKRREIESSFGKSRYRI
jgi:glucose-6-phosphate isomerase